CFRPIGARSGHGGGHRRRREDHPGAARRASQGSAPAASGQLSEAKVPDAQAGTGSDADGKVGQGRGGQEGLDGGAVLEGGGGRQGSGFLGSEGPGGVRPEQRAGSAGQQGRDLPDGDPPIPHGDPTGGGG